MKATKQTTTRKRLREGALPLGPMPGRRRAAGRPLTARQKAVLCQLAAAAHAHCGKFGVHDADLMKLEPWRRAQQGAALDAGRPVSLAAECGNNDFRPIKAHYLNMLGWSERAFVLWLHTGKAEPTNDPEDTHERREELRHLLRAELVEHRRRCTAPETPEERAAAATAGGNLITGAYLESVSRMKFGRPTDGLAGKELEQMLYTLRNRIAAREGRGDGKARNKAQRARKSRPAPSEMAERRMRMI